MTNIAPIKLDKPKKQTKADHIWFLNPGPRGCEYQGDPPHF